MTPTPSPTPPLGTSLYVADAGTNSIDVFPLSANGNVAPTFSFGSQSDLNYPISLVFDASGDLYAANEFRGGNSTSNVVMYRPPFSSSSTPAAALSYSGFDSTSIVDLAVDQSGNLYVLASPNSIGEYLIYVFAPGASGNASPTRTITPSMEDIGENIAVDSSTIYVSNDGGKVYEFPIGSSGTVTPTVLTGSATGFTNVHGVKIDDLDRLVVRNGKTVSRFAPGASGNAAPVSTIDTSAFDANASDFFDLCLDGGGNLFLVDSADGTAGDVSAVGSFPASDSGAVSPARTISGSMTGFNNPQACVVR